MSNPPDDLDGELGKALAELQAAIQRRVRAEQLRDQLTGLANDAALTEWLKQKVEEGSEFWLAFIEVDQFKSVNDRFGYADADVLLRRIADQLRNAAVNYFAERAMPYRAHGDEFYLGGNLADEKEATRIGEALDTARRNVATVKVETEKGPMSCTVSIGWLTSKVARESTEDFQERVVRRQLEEAVAAAKHTRNTIVAYTTDLAKAARRDGRAECSSCDCKFTATVPVDDSRSDALRCPNCGAEVDRPYGLRPESWA